MFIEVREKEESSEIYCSENEENQMVSKNEKDVELLGCDIASIHESVEQITLLTPSREQLTHSQNQRLQVYLENLKDVRQTIVQMLEVNIKDEEVSQNLLNLLDLINGALELQHDIQHSFPESEEIKQEQAEDHMLGEYRNAMALSQVVDWEDSENMELNYQLEVEYQKERFKQLREEIQEEAGIIREPEDSFARRIFTLYEKRRHQEYEYSEIESLSEELVRNDLIPESISRLEELGLLWNPLRDIEESLEEEQISSYALKGVFNVTTYNMRLWKAKPYSVVQYVEVKIDKKYRSFKEPFVLSLWEYCEESTLQVSPQVLSSLSPVGFSVFQNNGTLDTSATAFESLQEGDIFGIGAVPVSKGKFIIFGTHNGTWVCSFELQLHCDVDINSSHHVAHVFRLVLLTGSTFNVKQLDVSIITKMEDFAFARDQLSLEDCTICYSETLTHCMQVIDECGHQFCKSCMRRYLETVLQEGQVLGTTCPGLECTSVLGDTVIRDSLPTLLYGKFQQFRVLACMRIDPHARWCPVENCSGGAIGNAGSNESPKLFCSDCGMAFCYKCSQCWHEGYSCGDFARKLKQKERKHTKKLRKQADKGMKEWLKENKSIKCGKCGVLVQKAVGCNHITCRCGHEFCWLCGESVYVSIYETPLHYLSGACAGLQMSSKEELTPVRKAVRTVIAPVRFGITLPVAAVGSIARSLKGPK